MKLAVAKTLKLPADTVTSTGLVLGGKGMGKSTLGRVIAEELGKHRLRFAVIDPMDVWWGLRFNAEGTGPGVEVLILGGRHGDLPITATAGQIVADLVVDERANVIIVPAEKTGEPWSKGEKIRFVTAYMQQLCKRLGKKPEPILQIIDEAGRWIPQMIPAGAPDLAMCVGAIEQAVEEGRNYGLGVWMITQRSARINKSVAELADTMIAFRTVGPNSMKAILDWFGDNVPKERWTELTTRIRELPVGTALVVSPGWLKFEGEVAFRPSETFDSSSTPKPGQRRRAPKRGADVDVTKYQERMAATVAEAEAHDPKKLQRQIRELEAALSLSSKRAIQAVKNQQQGLAMVGLTKQPKDRIVKVPAITAIQMFGIRRAAAAFERGGKQAANAAAAMVARLDKIASDLKYLDFSKHFGPTERVPGGTLRMKLTKKDLDAATKPDEHAYAKFVERELHKAGRKAVDKALELDAPAKPLKAGARRMATVLATWHPRALTKTQLATLSGITPGSGTFYEYLRALFSCSLIESALTDELVRINPAVVDAWANGARPPANAREIAAMYAKALKKGARAMLDVLIEIGPDGQIEKTTLANQVNITAGSGTFYEYLRALVRNGLAVEHANGCVGPSDTLFMEQG